MEIDKLQDNYDREDSFGAYILGYFTESPKKEGDQHSLHLAYSYDALNWIPLNNNLPVLVPDIGEKGMRDPYIYKKRDNTFVVLATNMWNSEYIMCYDSEDLVHFTNGRLLRLNDSGMHAWAPEMFYDPECKEYAILWSGNTDRNRIYVNYTKDFTQVSDPQVYFDPGYNVIDANLITHDSTHYLFFKDERDPNQPPYEGKRVKVAKSISLKPGSFDSNVFAGPFGDPQFEAPMVIKKENENRWYLYGDNYYPANGKFYVWETNHIENQEWKPLNRQDYNTPLNVKHSSFLKVSKSQLKNLLENWGKKPSWNRIKSYGHPDFYLTYEDGFARLAAYPFDPYNNSLWKLVPGLADPSAISFESVNQPGYYLKPFNFVLRLEKSDGTEDFKNEATFRIVDGLSDSNGSSFVSHCNSDMYIKHDGSFLRLSRVTADFETVDSTFQIVW